MTAYRQLGTDWCQCCDHVLCLLDSVFFVVDRGTERGWEGRMPLLPCLFSLHYTHQR